jgi:hypothetical protein
MKESYNVVIVNTKSIMSQSQQAFYRERLKQVLEREEIISICLDDRSLFIEYNPSLIDGASVIKLLLKYAVPVAEYMTESISETHFA